MNDWDAVERIFELGETKGERGRLTHRQESELARLSDQLRKTLGPMTEEGGEEDG